MDRDYTYTPSPQFEAHRKTVTPTVTYASSELEAIMARDPDARTMRVITLEGNIPHAGEPEGHKVVSTLKMYRLYEPGAQKLAGYDPVMQVLSTHYIETVETYFWDEDHWFDLEAKEAYENDETDTLPEPPSLDMIDGDYILRHIEHRELLLVDDDEPIPSYTVKP